MAAGTGTQASTARLRAHQYCGASTSAAVVHDSRGACRHGERTYCMLQYRTGIIQSDGLDVEALMFTS